MPILPSAAVFFIAPISKSGPAPDQALEGSRRLAAGAGADRMPRVQRTLARAARAITAGSREGAAQQKLYRNTSGMRSRRKGTPMASPPIRTAAVQREAPNSTARAFNQSVTVIAVINDIDQISIKVNPACRRRRG